MNHQLDNSKRKVAIIGPAVILTFALSNCADCRYAQFMCEDGKGCVNASNICDGVKDCKDGSDEEDCSRSLYVVERCL